MTGGFCCHLLSRKQGCYVLAVFWTNPHKKNYLTSSSLVEKHEVGRLKRELIIHSTDIP